MDVRPGRRAACRRGLTRGTMFHGRSRPGIQRQTASQGGDHVGHTASPQTDRLRQHRREPPVLRGRRRARAARDRRAGRGDRRAREPEGRRASRPRRALFVWSMAAVAITGIGIDLARLCFHVAENHTKYAGYSMPSSYPARIGFLYAGVCVLYLLREAAGPRVFSEEHATRATARAWVPASLLAPGPRLRGPDRDPLQPLDGCALDGRDVLRVRRVHGPRAAAATIAARASRGIASG